MKTLLNVSLICLPLFLVCLVIIILNHPKRLGDVIAENIEDNPNDWTFTEINNTTNHFALMDISCPRNYILENKKSFIKMSLTTSYLTEDKLYGTRILLLEPDTLEMDASVVQKIYKAYNEFIIEPIEKRNMNIRDSTNEATAKLIIIKEQSIKNKICK